MIGPEARGRTVFGCGNFGGMGSSPAFRDHGDGAETAMALLDAARAAGLARFDTANTYGGGTSETLLGQWLRAQGPAFRAGAQVATKVGNPHGCPPGEAPLSRAQIAFHLDESLRRLGVERIDLYYLHEFDPITPIEETLEAISRAIAAGKIDAFGVSNASRDHIAAVLAAADATVRARFAYAQNEFSALATGDRATVIPFARDAGLRYVAFSPLAGGLLTGKYRQGAPAPAGSRLARASEHYAPLMTPESFATIAALAETARLAGDTPAGAALRFVMDEPGVDSLIIAPRTLAHLASYGLTSAAP